MKLIILNLLLPLTLAVADPMTITNLWLNDQVVMEIPIGLQRVTTVNFPRPIQSIDGAGLTTDGRVPGQFQLAQSSRSIALRALASGARGNLNVRLDDRTYVFLLTESRQPMLAVNFLAAPAMANVSGPAAPAAAPEQLVGLLDRARHFQTLRQHHPSLVSDVTLAQPRSVTDYSTFSVRLDEVFRFERADALVFHVTLRSKTGHEVRYGAGSWAVRVGDRLYSQALADASGVIPAAGEETAWFIIQGSPDGHRNLLSPRNPFIILVNPL